MSLFGTGRKEGIAAACLIGGFVALAHWFGAGLRVPDAAHVRTLIATAVGGMLAYRFLRADGRSRYAAFLGGASYGMAPYLAGLELAPREQLAAALAPLSLEAATHCLRAASRRRWLPWAGLAIAAPFVAGIGTVAVLAAAIGLGACTRSLLRADAFGERSPWPAVVAVAVFGALAAANLAWLDPLAAWLGAPTIADPLAVLAADPVAVLAFGPLPRQMPDAAAVLRVAAPLPLWFAVLGVLRWQRHASVPAWLVFAAAGAAPTVCAAQAADVTWLAGVDTIAAGAWWLVLLAVTMLGSAGLDDFLDLPMRRRPALWALFALTLVAVPAALMLTDAPLRFAVAGATAVVLALASLTWRRLGILRFKNALAVIALAALLLPITLHAGPAPIVPAAPGGETAPASVWSALLQSWQRPAWHFAGLAAAVLAAAAATVRNALRNPRVPRRHGAASARGAVARNQTARGTPRAATAAIDKNAPPAKRS